MTKNIYHITNGDSLTDRLKNLHIDGAIITMRECLIDGPHDCSKGFPAFFKSREGYIYKQFGQELSYKDYVLTQFQEMQHITDDSTVFFWFEDDLFCQANWWFLLYYLKSLNAKKYLIRSGDKSPYSFGHLSNEQLTVAFEAKLSLEEEELSQLWQLYATNNTEGFDTINNDLKKRYPFVGKAFKAHLERIPTDNYLGQPKETLKKLREERTGSSFGTIFKAFSKEAAIYGYGDVQVQCMLNEIK